MRNEKTLLSWPVPECPDIPQKKVIEEAYKKTYYHRFAAQLVEIDNTKILGFTIFNMGGGATERFWQSEAQNGYQVFEKKPYNYGQHRVPGKMYGACIDSEYNIYWGSADRFYSTPEEEKKVHEFLESDCEDLGLALGKYQRKLRENRIIKRDERQRKYMRERFSELGPIPKEFREWCIETVMKEDRYFFYEYTGRKLQRGKCSHCGTWSELPGIRQYGECICPACGSRLQVRSLRRLSSFDSFYRVGFLEVLKDEYCMRTFDAYIKLWKDPSGIPEREIIFYEEERVFMDRKLRCKEKFEKRGNFAVTVDGFHVGELYSPMNCYIFPGNLKELRNQMGIRTELEALAERGELWGCLNHIFDIALRRPATEYLIKNRFYKIAADVLKKYPGEETGLIEGGKNAAQVLGVPADELMKLRNTDPALQQLRTIRSLYINKSCIRQDEMEDICYLGISPDYVWTLQNMAERSSLRKALNYIKKQGRRNGGNRELIEWRDYMKMCELVGYNTNDPQVFFPKDIRAGHEQMQRLYESQKSELLTKGIERQAEKLSKLSWTYRTLCIRPAKSQKELIDEGQYLHHCVGKAGYDRKMAQGTTAIFFIRKKKRPDTPYVTLELSLADYSVIQCYAAHDRYPGDAVKNFYAKWEREIIPAILNKNKEVRSA